MAVKNMKELVAENEGAEILELFVFAVERVVVLSVVFTKSFHPCLIAFLISTFFYGILYAIKKHSVRADPQWRDDFIFDNPVHDLNAALFNKKTAFAFWLERIIVIINVPPLLEWSWISTWTLHCLAFSCSTTIYFMGYKGDSESQKTQRTKPNLHSSSNGCPRDTPIIEGVSCERACSKSFEEIRKNDNKRDEREEDEHCSKLAAKLAAATAMAEAYQHLMIEREEYCRKLEKARNDLSEKLGAATASTEIYRSLLHDSTS